jgi:bacterioferritin-associated ferredoxin
MYVCLCSGTTCRTVADAVARGAATCKQVAVACGAGLDCGRCLRNVKAIIESEAAVVAVAR